MFKSLKNRRFLFFLISFVGTAYYFTFSNHFLSLSTKSSHEPSKPAPNSKKKPFNKQFMLDYHSIFAGYPEEILRTETNAKCAMNKILFNNTFAIHLSKTSKSSQFKCNNLPRNEYVVEAKDSNRPFWWKWTSVLKTEESSPYQLYLDLENLQKLYNNTLLDPAKTTCYAEKFEKSEGNKETGSDALQMSKVKIYFNSSNGYKIGIKEHGYVKI